MAVRRFSHEPGAPARLVVGWSFPTRDIWIEADGERIHSGLSRKDLRKNRIKVELSDGVEFIVRYTKRGRFKGIEVSSGGRLLPGGQTGPWRRIKEAVFTLCLIGGMTLLFGLLLFDRDAFVGGSTAAIGAVFLGLAFLGWKRVQVALILGAVGIGLNMALLAVSVISGNCFAVVPILIQALFLRIVIDGVKAVPELRDMEKAPVTQVFD